MNNSTIIKIEYLNNKPMIERSRHIREFTESYTSWECDISRCVEWTHEGNLNMKVGVDGNPNRYNGSIC